MAKVRVIALTKPTKEFTAETGAQTMEDIISYSARVSNPKNQAKFDTAEKLLKYCAENAHWSVFAMGHAILEIETTRDISHQIIRHKSFDFQEFSTRYAEVDLETFVLREMRMADPKNRQNSFDNPDSYFQEVWEHKQQAVIAAATDAYEWAIKNGGAKECARAVLPEGLTPTRLYMAAPLRSFIHYIDVRTDPSTQKEHREIANMVFDALVTEVPLLKSLVKQAPVPVIWHERLRKRLMGVFGGKKH